MASSWLHVDFAAELFVSLRCLFFVSTLCLLFIEPKAPVPSRVSTQRRETQLGNDLMPTEHHEFMVCTVFYI